VDKDHLICQLENVHQASLECSCTVLFKVNEHSSCDFDHSAFGLTHMSKAWDVPFDTRYNTSSKVLVGNHECSWWELRTFSMGTSNVLNSKRMFDQLKKSKSQDLQLDLINLVNNLGYYRQPPHRLRLVRSPPLALGWPLSHPRWAGVACAATPENVVDI